MPVTFTIKHVPDEIAASLRRRAEVNRRSLQHELLCIVEAAVNEHLHEPAAGYDVKSLPRKPARESRVKGRGSAKLTLDELWARARKLGPPMPSESAAIVRDDRNARERR